MRCATITILAIVGMLATTAILATAGEPEFVITRSTIDGGGVMRSTGGDFELSGTIGQADAGVMTGGDFQLTGGFWFELSQFDCNEDGLVNLFDQEIFTACMMGPSFGIDADPCPCFDSDVDNDVTLRDFAGFQNNFAR